jgi:hypothetical protein
MSRVFTFILCCTLLLTGTFLVAQLGNAQVGLTQVQILTGDTELPNSGGKFPDIAGYANTVHAVSNPDARAAYWTKQDGATAWPDRTILGDADGQADYASASVGVGPNGFVAVTWINRDDNRIYARCKPPGGNFGPRQTVASATGFGIFVKTAVASNGQIFVIWNSDNRFRYSVSSDGCNNWSGRANVSDKQAFGIAEIAAGENGGVLVGFYSSGDIYAAEWNGSGFNTTRVDRGGNYFADPTVAVGGNGRFYIAWRGVSDGEVWYAERQPDGSWPNSLLADGGETAGPVAISADREGNLHIFWHNRGLQYAYKPVVGPWEGPNRVSDGGFNASSTATLSDRAYGHILYEVFTGSGLRTRYGLAASDAGPPPTPTPLPIPTGSLQINDGATITGKPAITVKITANNADQYRLSNDGTNFTEYANLPPDGLVPWELEAAPSGNTTCINRTVFGQLRSSANPSQESAVLQAAITFDPGIDATGSIRNPYLASNPAVFTQGDGVRLLENGTDGARDGDPRYTRIPGYFLEARGLSGECSGLESLTVNTSPGTVFGFDENNYLGVALALPQVSTENPVKSVQATMTDTVGYSQDFQQTIYYDSLPPLVTSGTPQVVDDSGQTITTTNSIIVTLSFEDMTIADNLYGENGEDKPFWGVWVANSLTNLDPNDPEDQDALNALEWSTVPVGNITANGETYTFSIPWSLFSGLSKDQWQGGVPYYTYARILDGAGNASTTTLEYEVSLSADYEVPQINLPLVAR